MPISPVLSRKLQEQLGQDTGEDLVAWMEGADTLHDDVALLRGDVQDARRDIRQLGLDLKRDLQEMRLGLETRMDIGFAMVEAKFERRISDLMKWSFVFWVGAVAAIAMLAGVLP